ncbi:DEAD/DEAH box helicase [Paucibacter sp. TC2R-5]|uniref:DEAD/DEAH box helicase n=1 Tax=Paucibacter sp. TC2R-5 TaxID=2893555 RepID=UPI0021E4D02A|nr:DEAD/DEAH box helicase [Paucibacter sp. TC2R-5]MCV2359950.1 DEAD/DEAH box helicase [Paucibacter sp. TC2R-5]
MSSFALELSKRFTDNEKYWTLLLGLQSAGVAKTLVKAPEIEEVSNDDLAKLLYCAEVFVQTDDEGLHRQAQEIAIQALLVTDDGHARERALGLLSELGNFPSLKFAEQNIGKGDDTLLGLINRRVSERASSVQIGEETIALTAYQRRVWQNLSAKAAQVITAPTSAGKSFLVLEHLCRLAESMSTFTAVYVTPTRALLSEVQGKLQARFIGRTDVRISSIPSLDQLERPKQIFVLTQERLSTLISLASEDLLFDVVVVDEAQNIADDARGMILQDCLERLAQASSKTKVILLAPGAVGMQALARSFGVVDLVPLSTRLSPVQQNRIVLSKVRGKPLQLEMALMGRNGVRKLLGEIRVERSLSSKTSRLATVAVELGGDDGSLLYETGPREAEKTAALLEGMLKAKQGVLRDASLEDLAKFIREHVHPEYQLASMVQQGVAYHYGRMPSLLREAIEASFKQDEGGISYLVCTTTLAQGVNLPARNVFIDTPTRGAGKPLDPALLWNFAGRAGRLNHDIVGNVFLVNYEDWDTKPMDEFVPFQVEPALAETLTTSGLQVAQALLEGVLPPEQASKPETLRIRACAGLLVAHAARKDVKPYLTRVMPAWDSAVVDALAAAADTAYNNIDLPDHILAENWTIDPFGLRRLYDYLIAKIGEGAIESLIPVNPADAPKDHYEKLFGRIVEQVNGQSMKFGMLAAPLAVWWMKGMPYPVMLKMWAARRARTEERKAKAALAEGKEPQKSKTINQHIYEAFSLIEDVVRFQFVQLGKAYRDVLLLALRETGNESRVKDVFPFALALELGVSTEAGTAYVELGLSRIAAAALEALAAPGETLNADGARKLLRELDPAKTTLSPIILGELRRLGLIAESKLTVPGHI